MDRGNPERFFVCIFVKYKYYSWICFINSMKLANCRYVKLCSFTNQNKTFQFNQVYVRLCCVYVVRFVAKMPSKVSR